ncbi:MAG: C10 family peptidase [Prevotellaceae bacterium]|jgi:hypothetical protein|nr:C10 family peptidase [Prevotellaceae bacterium]
MKKIIILLLCYVLPTFVYSQQITLGEAQIAAINAVLGEYEIKERDNIIKSLSIDTINTYSVKDTVFMYEVIFSNSKGILLSGNKNCLPILGHFDSTWGSIFDKNTPCCLTDFLEGYVYQIRESFNDGRSNFKNIERWNKLLLGNINYAPASVIVSPLTTSIWGQSFSNDYRCSDSNNDDICDGYSQGDCEAYNYYVTESNNCNDVYCATGKSKKSYAGCVAVAMAQIMYYHKYPMSFDWCNMTDELLSTSSNYIAERNSVARLIERCADAVEMDYGCDGSSSTATKAKEALWDYGYSNADLKLWPQTNLSKVKENLDDSLPVYFGAWGPNAGGHSFVCDGYRSDDYFHFNWGWSGRWGDVLQDNKWFTLDNLYSPSGQYWNIAKNMIVDIYPEENFNFCDYNITIPNSIFNVLKPVIPTVYLTTLTIGGSGSTLATVNSGENYAYKAHQAIYLKDGFQAKSGSTFRAYIEPCANCPQAQLAPQRPYAENSETEFESSIILSNSEPQIRIFPNPNKGTFSLQTNFSLQEILKVKVVSLLGQTVFEAASLQSERINIPSESGVYIVSVYTKDKVFTEKIIVE